VSCGIFRTLIVTTLKPKKSPAMIYKQVSYYVYKSFHLCKTNVIIWDQVVIVSNMFYSYNLYHCHFVEQFEIYSKFEFKKIRLLMICLNS
jgi:hypothetical protein